MQTWWAIRRGLGGLRFMAGIKIKNPQQLKPQNGLSHYSSKHLLTIIIT